MAAVLDMPNLVELGVFSPALTDVVFEHLSRSKTLLKIRLVDQDTQPPAALTNEGLFLMQEAQQLRELWLPRQHTGLTEEMIGELKKLMPRTGVIPYSVRWKPQ